LEENVVLEDNAPGEASFQDTPEFQSLQSRNIIYPQNPIQIPIKRSWNTDDDVKLLQTFLGRKPTNHFLKSLHRIAGSEDVGRELPHLSQYGTRAGTTASNVSSSDVDDRDASGRRRTVCLYFMLSG
jgi:hypothetical protein